MYTRETTFQAERHMVPVETCLEISKTTLNPTKVMRGIRKCNKRGITANV